MDWTYQPEYEYVGEIEGPTVLKVRLEDKKPIRRRKNPTTVRVFVEKHTGVTRATMGAMKAFYAEKGQDVAFTKQAFDPEDPNDLVPVTVIFADPKLKFTRDGADSWKTTIRFEEVV